MAGKHSESHSESGVLGGVGDVLHGMATLAELQAHLFAADLNVASRQLRIAALAFFGGTCIVLGSVPLALYTLSVWLKNTLQCSEVAAATSALAIGLSLGLCIMIVAVLSLRSSVRCFERSKSELRSNFCSIKNSFKKAF